MLRSPHRTVGMTGRYKELTNTIGTHWSLFTMIRDNWGWATAAVGLGGVGGWWAWLSAHAAAVPWYTKGLAALIAFLIVIFLVAGVRAFLAWQRRSAREEGAIASGLSWSGHTYSNGSIITGGTHRLAEIFGADQLRSNLTFRNCQILGPGAVAYYVCHSEKSEYFGLPAVQFIDPRYAGEISTVVYQFIKCRFENCVFSKMLHIQRFPNDMPDGQVYRMVRSSFEESEWPINPSGKYQVIPAVPGSATKVVAKRS